MGEPVSLRQTADTASRRGTLPGRGEVAPFDIGLATRTRSESLLRDPSHVLALIAPNEECVAATLAEDPRLVSMGLPLLGGEAALEVWTSPTPVACGRWRDIVYTTNQHILVGQLRLDATAAGLAEAVERAYAQILEFGREQACANLLRAWNFIPGLNRGHGDSETYKQFCLGRARALASETNAASSPPAASCVGRAEPGALICFIAAESPATVFENPRQVSAYSYPRQYGPAAPSFSRAALQSWAGSLQFFTSGTASIVGHETLHVGDPARQASESLANIEAILAEVNLLSDSAQPLRLDNARVMRVYVRHPEQLEAVRAVVDPAVGKAIRPIYVGAEICRHDLLVEIEACWNAASVEVAG